ncbi:hypothetical protein M427DRAFT_249974 [Gonapodya prolifera JEL478]|uniref:Uncharacterized protein n=1 Tax=Gonapodya prolifera (strain JEL478) TaxID=1344416 RepID=A0A138ZXF9_GONPJ|nr:hypothetical protein M427DRAFT_249974 [Gonapodya prolifera JEL478]|eukprot:KXS09144.1 hypothetical protein M427DRAFT_249974 [Gonapodya prolifera JEL478]
MSASTGTITYNANGLVLIPPGVGTHVRVMQAVWVACLTMILISSKRVKLNIWTTQLALFMWAGQIIHHWTIAYMKVFPPSVFNYGCAAAFVSAVLVVSEPSGVIIEGYQAQIVFKQTPKLVQKAVLAWVGLIGILVIMANICLVVMQSIYSTGINPTPNPWQDASNYLTFVSLYMRAGLGLVVAGKLFAQSRSLSGSALGSVAKRIYSVAITQTALAVILTIGITPPANEDVWYSSIWIYPVLITTDFIYANSALQGFESGGKNGDGSNATESASGAIKKGLVKSMGARASVTVEKMASSSGV